MDELIIRRSRKKLYWQFFGFAFFFLVFLLMVFFPEFFSGKLWNSRNLIKVCGSIGALFMLYELFSKTRKLNDRTPGLILDEQGYINNVSLFPGEKILWKDISAIDEFSEKKQRMISVHLKDPDAFTSRFRKDKKETASLLEIYHGPPFFISANDFDADADQLLTSFRMYHDAHHSPRQPNR